MNKIVSIVFSGLFLVSCASYPTSSNAAEKPNILIMGEDADKDTVPRKSRVFNRVLDALSNELHNEGFNALKEILDFLETEDLQPKHHKQGGGGSDSDGEEGQSPMSGSDSDAEVEGGFVSTQAPALCA